MKMITVRASLPTPDVVLIKGSDDTALLIVDNRVAPARADSAEKLFSALLDSSRVSGR